MISIVIPTLNRPQSLVKLVESLKKQAVSVPFEILVVYNSSAEAANTSLRSTQNLKVLFAPQKGVNRARNRGISAACGAIILFIDDDCEPCREDFLQQHWDLHIQNPKLIAIGGPYQLPEKATFWDQVYQKNNENWIDSNLVATNRTLALLGGNTSYKQAAFKHGFLFTEEIVYGGSETPLNTLLTIKYGALGYFKELSIIHHTQMNLFSLIHKAFRQGAGAALQTKIFGHQLIKTTELSDTMDRRFRTALGIYAFIFMVGYKSTLLEKGVLIVLLRELWSRFVFRQKKKWDSRIGKTRALAVQNYWWSHSLLNKVYWQILNKYYWQTYSFLSRVILFIKLKFYGVISFWNSLWEPPEDWTPELNWPTRASLRTQIIFRKIGWLFLKTVRLR
jgi:glycosyltransferase involved in cell wall biosynthesis